jgi:SynChlorMet cassette radical SAM/SPASM protein ScmE
LQRNGVKATVRITVHRHNVRDLENIAKLLLVDLSLSSVSTNAAGYMGSCRGNEGDVLLNSEERHLAMLALERLAAIYPGRISAMAGPLADARMWRRMEEARAKGESAFPGTGGRLSACGCSEHKIAVRADGAIVPCSMLPHIVLGRINQDPLQTIWQSAPALNRLRARRSIPLADFEFCAGCAFIPYCTGNCPGLAYSLTGKVDHPSPDACLRRFLSGTGATA